MPSINEYIAAVKDQVVNSSYGNEGTRCQMTYVTWRASCRGSNRICLFPFVFICMFVFSYTPVLSNLLRTKGAQRYVNISRPVCAGGYKFNLSAHTYVCEAVYLYKR